MDMYDWFFFANNQPPASSQGDDEVVPSFNPSTFPLAFYTDASRQSVTPDTTGLPQDFSINGRNTAQPILANRPTYKSPAASYPFNAWLWDSTDIVAVSSFQSFPGMRGAIFALYQQTVPAAAAQTIASTWNGTTPNWQFSASTYTPTPYKWFDGALRNTTTANIGLINRWNFDLLIRNGDSNMELWRNGVKLQDIVIASTQPAANPLYIGGVSTAANFANGRLAVQGIYNGPMSLSQRASIIKAHTFDRGLINVVHDGASNTYGLSNGLIQGQPWPDQLALLTAKWLYGQVVAVAGNTTQVLIDNAPTRVDPKYNPNAVRNIITFGDNTGNDFAYEGTSGGLNVDQAFAKAEEYIAARRAANPRWEIGITLPTHMTTALAPPDINTRIDAYNAKTLAESSADFIIPIGTNAGLTDSSNLTNYRPDGVHFTTAGAAIAASVVNTAFNTYLA